jgi:hypothetical protein
MCKRCCFSVTFSALVDFVVVVVVVVVGSEFLTTSSVNNSAKSNVLNYSFNIYYSTIFTDRFE